MEQSDRDIRDNKVVGIVQRGRQIFATKKSGWIFMIGEIILFLCLYYMLVRISVMSTFEMTIGSTLVHTSTVKAFISHLLMMISVLLTIIHRRVGFISAVILHIICIAGAAMSIAALRNRDSVEGVINFAFELVVIIILYAYVKYAEKKLEEINEQKQEMLALYEQIAASEETLISQNSQLEEYNVTLRERESELNQLAFNDPLTGLANRRCMSDFLSNWMKSSKTRKKQIAIVFADLDNFKKINDSAGHHVGDCILRMIASRWKQLIHKQDLLVRLGGDEFAFVIPGEFSEEAILHYVTGIKETLNQKFSCYQREFYVKASFGISIYPRDGEDTTLLLKAADMAMYEAKGQHQNGIAFFDAQIQEHLLSSIELENSIRSALEQNEFYLNYQPQFSCKGKKLRGFEVLMRWMNQQQINIPPSRFIPVAEDSGDIIQMGEWILEKACVTCLAWMKETKKQFMLAVNISVVQLLDPGFLSMLMSVLEKTEFPPSYLELEVTESMFISSMDTAVSVLKQVRKQGIKVALDDFGTGYASISYLQMLPIDIIKIDKTFIDSINGQKKERALVNALITVAHELDYAVIAEGVEEVPQLDAVRNLGCDYIQGYLLGRPVSEQEALKLLKEQV